METVMHVTGFQLDALTRTIFGEARGESFEGKVAVAHVVLNRARIGGWWGSTIDEVVHKPWQFSCWNPDDPNRAVMLAADESNVMFRHCMYAALGAVDGHLPDPTQGATHYHNASVSPSWAEGKGYLTIGGHRFYSGID